MPRIALTNSSREKSSLIISGLTALACSLSIGCSGVRPLHVIRDHALQEVKAGNYAVAATDYEEYLERKPDEVNVRYELGKTYLAMNEPMKARQQLAVAYDIDPTNENVIDARAEAHYQAKEFQQLSEFLRRLSSERGAVRDFLRLGDYAGRMGNADEASLALKNAAVLDEGRTVAPQIALADFYKLHNDRANEVRRLRMALFVEPKNKAVMNRLLELGEIPGPSLALRPEEAR